MKSIVVLAGLLAAIGVAQCVQARSTSDITKAFEQAVGNDVEQLLNIALSNTEASKGEEVAYTKHRDDREDVRIAARYIVPPDNAKDFVEVFEKQKDSAMGQDGTVDYRLFKTLDDNVTFLFAGVWKSYEDLMDHLKSDSTIKFLNDLADLRVVFKTTQIIEVAADKGRHSA